MNEAYSIDIRPFCIDFSALPKREVKNFGVELMQIMDKRLDYLEKLWFEECGAGAGKLDFSRDSVAALSGWFFEKVEARKRSEAEKSEIRSRMGNSRIGSVVAVPDFELTDLTLSLCLDIGFYFGRSLQFLFPNLRWEQDLSSKRSINYGWLVLSPFVGAPLNPVRICRNFAYGVIDKNQRPDRLLELFDIWSSKVVTL